MENYIMYQERRRESLIASSLGLLDAVANFPSISFLLCRQSRHVIFLSDTGSRRCVNNEEQAARYRMVMTEIAAAESATKRKYFNKRLWQRVKYIYAISAIGIMATPHHEARCRGRFHLSYDEMARIRHE